MTSARWARLDVPWRATLRGVVVVAGPRGAVVLSGVAVEVWHALEQPRTRAELATTLAASASFAEMEAADPMEPLVANDLIARLDE